MDGARRPVQPAGEQFEHADNYQNVQARDRSEVRMTGFIQKRETGQRDLGENIQDGSGNQGNEE